MMNQATRYKNLDGEIVCVVRNRLSALPYSIEVNGKRLDGYLATASLDEAQFLLDDIADAFGWRVYDEEYEKLCMAPRPPIKSQPKSYPFESLSPLFQNMQEVELNVGL